MAEIDLTAAPARTASAASGARAPPARRTRSATRGGRPRSPASFAASRAADAGAAVDAAREAFPAWAALPAAQRAAIFFKAADALEARVEQIAQDMTAEMGKPLREARGEAARAAAILRFSAGEAYRPAGEVYEPSVQISRSARVRRPLGVVGLITPWNFPAAIPVWKLAPALDLRQHRRAQARLRGAAHRPPHRGVLRGGRASGRASSTCSPAQARRSGPSSSRNPGARDLVHGLGAGRPRRPRRGDGPQLPCAARARRPQPADRDGRRRARPRRRGGVRRRLLVGGQKCTATRRIHVQDAVYDDFRDEAARADRRRQGRRPGRSRDRGRPGRQRGAVGRDPRCDRARQGRGRHGRSPAASARRRGLPDRADRVRGRRRRRLPLLRGGVRAGHLALSLLDARRGAASARTRSSSGSPRRSSPATSTPTQRFANELQAGILHVNSQTAGADVHVPFGGLKGSAWGPHEQGRAAMRVLHGDRHRLPGRAACLSAPS